jgi:hypothetical protein
VDDVVEAGALGGIRRSGHGLGSTGHRGWGHSRRHYRRPG